MASAASQAAAMAVRHLQYQLKQAEAKNADLQVQALPFALDLSG